VAAVYFSQALPAFLHDAHDAHQRRLVRIIVVVAVLTSTAAATLVLWLLGTPPRAAMPASSAAPPSQHRQQRAHDELLSLVFPIIHVVVIALATRNVMHCFRGTSSMSTLHIWQAAAEICGPHEERRHHTDERNRQRRH
jgi:heme/copper-type cytochrome/quinol oxidase subunit 2